MDSTSPSKGPRRGLKGVSGFTLLEIMMVTLISSFVFWGVIGSYIFLGRALARQVNEQSLESRARLTLYWFNQDISSASGIAAQNPGTGVSGNMFVLTIPGASGNVTYYCNWTGGTGSGILERIQSGTTLNLLTNITSISFSYFDMSGNPITVPASNSTQQMDIKQVFMTFTTTAGVKVTGDQSNYTVVSPGAILRNKTYPTDPNYP